MEPIGGTGGGGREDSSGPGDSYVPEGGPLTKKYGKTMPLAMGCWWYLPDRLGVGGPYQPKLDIGKVLEFSRICLPPLKSLTRFQKRNFRVQKRGGSCQKYPKCAPFLFLVCFSGFSGFKPPE